MQCLQQRLQWVVVVVGGWSWGLSLLLMESDTKSRSNQNRSFEKCVWKASAKLVSEVMCTVKVSKSQESVACLTTGRACVCIRVLRLAVKSEDASVEPGLWGIFTICVFLFYKSKITAVTQWERRVEAPWCRQAQMWCRVIEVKALFVSILTLKRF